MSTASFDVSTGGERLSALVDGELDGAVFKAACAAWCDDVQARRDWHAWHLIGDVLRSDDLASHADHDARFLAAVRARLTTEPVVLAPAAPASASRASGARGSESFEAFSSRASGAYRLRRPGGWALGSAVAAGFMLVAGSFAVLRTGDAPGPASPSVALADSADAPAFSAAVREAALRQPLEPATTTSTATATAASDGRLIRDAQLDRYLFAHKQFAGSSALAVPSPFLRSASLDSAER